MLGCGVLTPEAQRMLWLRCVFRSGVICFDYFDFKARIGLQKPVAFFSSPTLTECAKSITYLKASLNSQKRSMTCNFLGGDQESFRWSNTSSMKQTQSLRGGRGNEWRSDTSS